MNKKEIITMLKSTIDKDVYKRLRPIINRAGNSQKSGYDINLHLPVFINIHMDDKFYIRTNPLTYTFYNRKVAVTIWKDEKVPAQITVYS